MTGTWERCGVRVGVIHVCTLTLGHDGPHACWCGPWKESK
jgi:hypothetical protein